MDFTSTEYKRCDVIKAKGRIDSYTAPQMEEALNKVMEKGRYNIVFDTSDITFVSSAGWWALIRVQKTCKGKPLIPGEVVLAKLDPKIQESMDLVGISNYFKVFDDVIGAVAHF